MLAITVLRENIEQHNSAGKENLATGLQACKGLERLALRFSVAVKKKKLKDTFIEYV